MTVAALAVAEGVSVDGPSRVIVTGSRTWSDAQVIRLALNEVLEDFPRPWVLVHGGNGMRRAGGYYGDQPLGADAISDSIWRTWGRPVEVYWARWDELGRAAGPIRNRRMVNDGADLCLAFPLGESRGTYSTIALAEAADIPVRVFGSV